MEPDQIGVWSEIKLAILREYASAYTTILRKKTWCREKVYIDAFAGAGIHLSRTTGEMVPGSPLNALRVEPRFDRIELIDLDSHKADSLRELCAGDERVHIHTGDCNEVLPDRVLPRLTGRTKRRALCVLDPYGIHGKQLLWQTIQAIADLGTTEIFLNFPLMDINRNVLRGKLSKTEANQIELFNGVCGDSDWKDAMYRQQPMLFGGPEHVKIGNSKTLATYFGRRLRDVAGFEFVPEPAIMRNSVGGELYFLFFASHQAVAGKIVNDIFDKYRSYL